MMSIADQTKHSAHQLNGMQASTSQGPQIVTEVLRESEANSPNEAPQIAASQANALVSPNGFLSAIQPPNLG